MSNNSVGAVVDQLSKVKVSSQEEHELSFADRGLHLDNEEQAEEIVSEIKKCPHLTALRLEGNTIGVDAAKAIGKALEAHPEFQRALWRDAFTGRLKTEIPKALMFLSGGLMLAGARLVELDLSDNALGPVGVQGIKELLGSSTCYTLQELRLNNNGLGIGGGQQLARSLLECHAKSSAEGCPLKLRVLICGRNRLENEGAKAFAEFIKKLTSLEEIQMPQNGIFFEGITALSEAFAHNLNLKHLNLNDNIFTVEGARAVSQVLPKLENLEVINFGDCLLTSEGARFLAKSIKGHKKLRELNVGYNEIDLPVALELVDILDNKPALQKLEINGNQLGSNRNSLKTKLESLGKSHILGSISDDEDDEDDDEDEEESKDKENEFKEEEEEDSGEESKGEKIPDKGGVEPLKCMPEEFLASPSANYLLGLGHDRAKLLVGHIQKDPRGVEKYVDAFMKVGLALHKHTDGMYSILSIPDNVKEAANECIDAILTEGFKVAESEESASIFANTFLVYMGLIKSEDKSVKPPSDLTGALIVLEYAVRQPYFPRSTKEMLQFFLSRFHEAVQKTGGIKHRLMQTLYQY